MSTKFIEVLSNSGVDDTASPVPEMIVPLKGTNDILLVDAGGLSVKPETANMLDIAEVNDFVRKDLPKPRKFWRTGKSLPGKGGTMVIVRRGSEVVKQLRVFVLDTRIVRLAVRPLQTGSGVSTRIIFRTQQHLSMK